MAHILMYATCGVLNGIIVSVCVSWVSPTWGRQLPWIRARFALSAITHIVSVPCLPRERAFTRPYKRTWVRACVREHACVNYATRIEPRGASCIRRTCTHDRRRHLVWLPSPIINARHMPRSLIRWFYTPVCPVCLWWHVTAVKAASTSSLGRSIPQTEGVAA